MSYFGILDSFTSITGVKYFFALVSYEIVLIWVCVCILRPLVRWSDGKIRKRPEPFKIKLFEKLLFVVSPIILISICVSYDIDITYYFDVESIKNNTGDVEDIFEPDLPRHYEILFLSLILFCYLLFHVSILFYFLGPFWIFLIAAGSIVTKKAVDRYLTLSPIDQTPVPLLRSCVRVICMIAILSQPFPAVILFDLKQPNAQEKHETSQKNTGQTDETPTVD